MAKTTKQSYIVNAETCVTALIGDKITWLSPGQSIELTKAEAVNLKDYITLLNTEPIIETAEEEDESVDESKTGDNV